MEEFYAAIEEKIKASGYPKEVDGCSIYTEISDFIEDKENGSYLYLSKNHEDDVFEYQIDVLTDQFNLSTLSITSGDQNYFINFDA
ncbi:hypothetical protein [Anaerosporobacter faecicola]|uniref:hypothetical protein n=1 Tax=Anaerosporobacter faecicola TaxID=2718714 RepID=UPI001439805E|nr:hypothetical protein [Anaerosporobacter faecicola]